MEYLHGIVDFIIHIDHHLDAIIQSYGALTYGILFLIVLCETGLVVTPFLPGDSLLFAAGAFAGKGSLNVSLLLLLLSIAAIVGDGVNFGVGHFLGKKVFSWNSRWIKREHLDATNRYFDRHGGKSIVFARFIPIMRTFVPFVAGVGKMSYVHFLSYNIFGGLLWVFLFVGGGYFFGSLPFVEKNFSLVILIIIAVSVMPALYHWLRSRLSRAR